MLATAPEVVRKLVLIGVSTLVMAIVGVLLWRSSPVTHETTGSPSAIRESGSDSGAESGSDAWMRAGLTLVFAGALGNLIDRVFRGTVTDFIQVFIGSYEFPSFNVADSAITIGAGLLVIDLLRNRKTAS